MKKIAVIIINYRTPALIENSLNFQLNDIQSLDVQVVVVDNHSNDGSADRLDSWLKTYPARDRVNLIRSPANTGFSGGNNIGMASQSAEYYLLLNSDAYLLPGALRILLETAESNPEAGIVSPRLQSQNGTSQRSCFRFHAPPSELISTAGVGLVARILKRFDVTMPLSDELMQPHWTSFACVLLRATAAAEIGLMDEGYFMYFEDVDFSRQLRQAGWKILYQPAARAVHLGGESSPAKTLASQRKRLPKYCYASRTRYYYKFYGRLGLTAANLLWTLGWAIALVRALFGRPVANVTKRQVWDIWTNWRDPLGDRHAPEG